MDFGFGEIVEPSSRAFWDDYDDTEEENIVFEPLEWKIMDEAETQCPAKIDLFVIFEGQGITSFLNSRILENRSPVCQLLKGNASVYNLPNNITICISEEKDLNLFSAITEKLQKWLSIADKVVGISFQPPVSYKGISNIDAEQVCFIKTLNPKDASGEYGVLEVPNIVSGVVAGVVSWRKFNNLSAHFYAIFLESLIFDSLSSKPIVKLFKHLQIPCNEKQGINRGNATSNLYI